MSQVGSVTLRVSKGATVQTMKLTEVLFAVRLAPNLVHPPRTTTMNVTYFPLAFRTVNRLFCTTVSFIILNHRTRLNCSANAHGKQRKKRHSTQDTGSKSLFDRIGALIFSDLKGRKAPRTGSGFATSSILRITRVITRSFFSAAPRIKWSNNWKIYEFRREAFNCRMLHTC